MYFILTYVFSSTINAIVIVKIHRSAIYNPASPCAFLRNASWSTDASIQSCIWECVHENYCQTAVYFNDEKRCSMFAEFCKPDSIQPSGSARANVICYRKNQDPLFACSSTMTSSLAEEDTTTVSSMITSTVKTFISSDVFWSFDNNVLDLYNNFDANTFGNPTYTTSYLGTGAALSLTGTYGQYAAVTSSQLLFNSSSHTIETWIYPINLINADYGIFGQCHVQATNLCMFFIVRNQNLCCGFWTNDLVGSTNLTMNTWSHVACVYDLATQTQQVWLNGELDGSRSTFAYYGSYADTTIGVGYLTPPGSNFFNGYLDQMQFSFRAKNATEILNDATLVVYYSFDGGSLYDNGPNGINASVSGNLTTVTGRVNEALQFSSGAYISPSYPAFYMLGVSDHAFTMSLWVKPTGSVAQSAIVFVNDSPGWCFSFITIRSNGQIMLNLWNSVLILAPGPVLLLSTWTHIGYTYSTSNGIRLYVNGTQYSTSGASPYSAANRPVFITLGLNRGASGGCSPGYGGGFNGALDEFYLFSRELTAVQILALASP